MPERPADCRRGDDALARGAWTEAREAFEKALARRESPEALEGLGTSAWWLDLADLVFESRERAYRLFIERGDKAGASRVAVWIAWDCWAFRGETAVANGWLQRARRLLDGEPPCAELAWLESRESALALFEDGDPARAEAHANAGEAAARAAHNTDLELLARSLRGLARVASGEVVAGLNELDEVNAAIVSGEMKDLVAIGLASCYMIAGCDRVRDYERAAQWCARLKAFSAKWGLRPLFAVCRTQYASICMWRGTWPEAERELTAATDELAASRPAMSADGVVRLGELRRRQGRIQEAASLFEQAGHHPLASLGRAELAYDADDMRGAAEQAERCLRRVLPNNLTDRAAALDLVVRASVGAGDVEHARSALAELTVIADAFATPPLRASSSLCKGLVARVSGDVDAARRHLEDAVDGYLESGAPFEVGSARLELARALALSGRPDAARGEARRAFDLMTELRAERAADRARQFLQSLEGIETAKAPPSAPLVDPVLTRRELEVLRLVADGFNNQIIGEKLFVSEHTVHRHMANIFDKLSVSSRAAAVAQAARRKIL